MIATPCLAFSLGRPRERYDQKDGENKQAHGQCPL